MAVTQAGLEGIIAAESNICFIDGDRGILSYQGYNIHTLAEHATFEEVIYLLWHGRLPKQSELDALKADLVKYRPIPKEVAEFLGTVPKSAPMDVLRTAVSMLGLYDPKARDNAIEASVEKAGALDGANRDHRHHLRPSAQRKAGGGGRSEARLRGQFPLHADRQQARTT